MVALKTAFTTSLKSVDALEGEGAVESVELEVESVELGAVESVELEVELVELPTLLSPVSLIAGSMDDGVFTLEDDGVFTLGLAIAPGEIEEELFGVFVFVNESHGIVFKLSVYRFVIYFTK